MASKKHYYKLADALGTFKYYLKHDDIDIEDEFDNLVSHVMTIFKDDNKDFKEDIFANEIKKIYNERFVEYNTELVEDDEDMEFQFRSPEHFKMWGNYVEWKSSSNINYSYRSILYRDDDTDIFSMMTYFDIKIKTWDAKERPMKKLSKDDIEMIVYRVREDLAESGSMDTQGETHLLTFDNGGLTSK